MTKVSIVIPCFKQAHFVGAAIDSALAQRDADVEVILVDDGSPDGTRDVAAGFMDRPNFRYVRQENTGLPGARNRGIKEATGEYLCFLDSDDVLLPEKIAKQSALLDQNASVGWVYCDITTTDERGLPLPHQYTVAELKRTLEGDIFDSLLLGGYFPPHAVMIRRAVLNQVGGFDAALGGHADYELWLRVAGAGFETRFVPERLVLYRQHGANMSKDLRHMDASRIATLQKIARMYPDRVGYGIGRLQREIQDQFAATQEVARRAEAAETRNVAADAIRFDASWRAKLDAGIELALLKQNAAAAKMMLGALHSLEKCPYPGIMLQALLAICPEIARIDNARARYLARTAVALAGRLNASAELTRAIDLESALSCTAPEHRTGARANAESSHQ